jgi:hypothetical protein
VVHRVERTGLVNVFKLMEIMDAHNFDDPRAWLFKSAWGCRINSALVPRQYWAAHDVSQNQKIGVQP